MEEKSQKTREWFSEWLNNVYECEQNIEQLVACHQELGVTEQQEK